MANDYMNILGARRAMAATATGLEKKLELPPGVALEYDKNGKNRVALNTMKGLSLSSIDEQNPANVEIKTIKNSGSTAISWVDNKNNNALIATVILYDDLSFGNQWINPTY